ncbi:hypothetical protein ACLOJK_001996 [Asimina triloba]
MNGTNCVPASHSRWAQLFIPALVLMPQIENDCRCSAAFNRPFVHDAAVQNARGRVSLYSRFGMKRQRFPLMGPAGEWPPVGPTYSAAFLSLPSERSHAGAAVHLLQPGSQAPVKADVSRVGAGVAFCLPQQCQHQGEDVLSCFAVVCRDSGAAAPRNS